MIKFKLFRYILAATIFALASGAMGAWGVAYSWTGTPGDGTSWNDSGNWNPAAVPGSGDDVTINSAVTITTQSATATTIKSLLITAGVTLNLGNDLIITADAWGANNNLDLESSGITINLNGHTLQAGMTLYGSATNGSALTLNGPGAFTTNHLDASDVYSSHTTMTNGVTYTVSSLPVYLDYVVNYFSGDGTCTAAFPSGMAASPLVVFDNVTVQNGANTYTFSTSGAIAAGQVITVSIGGSFASTLFTYEINVATPTSGENYQISGVTTPSNSINDASGTIATTASSVSFSYTLPATVATGHGATLTVYIPGGTAIGSVAFTQSSTTNVWIGNDTLWTNTGNWSLGSVPVAGDTVIIPQVGSGKVYPTASGTIPTTGSFSSLTVDSGATLTLGGSSLNVTGTIANNGTIVMSGAETISGTKANGPSSTIEFVSGSTISLPVAWGTSYRSLSIATGTTLSLGTTSVTIPGTLTVNGQLNIDGTGEASSVGTLANNGTIILSSTGTIQKSDSDSGTFIYSTTTGTIPALNGYNILEISAGTHSQTNTFSTATLTVDSTATLTLGSTGVTVTGTLNNTGTLSLDGTAGQILGSPSITNGGASTVIYTGTAATPIMGTTYVNLTVSAGSFSATTGLTINGLLTVSGGASATFNNGAGQTTQAATADFSTAVNISLGNDTADQFSITAGTLALSGSTPSFTLAGKITASGGISLGNNIMIAGNTVFASSVTLADNVILAMGTSTLGINNSFDCTTHNFETTGSGLVTVGNPTGNITSGTGTLTFGNPVTNLGAIAAGSTGDGTIAITFTDNYTGSSGTLNGNTTTNPVLDFKGATVSIGTLNANGDTILFSGTTQTITPGTSTYANVESSATSASFGNNPFTQSTSASFTVSAGAFSIGTGQFICGNLSVTGGSFTQTGLNTLTQSASSIGTTGSGTVAWDSGTPVGGTLSLGGNVTPSGGAINFNHKNITFTATASISGTFYGVTINNGVTVHGQGIFRDLTIDASASFIADADTRIMRNLTIVSTGSYTPGGHILTLGGTGSEAGDITDGNATPISLGAVTIDGEGPTIKTALSALSFTSLTVSAGTVASQAWTITVSGNTDASAGTWTSSGTINAGGDLTLGSFTGTTSTINLNGSALQIFTTNTQNLGYLTLPVGGSNTIRISGTLNIGIDLSINGTQTLDLATNNVTANVTGITTNSGTITGGSADITFGGNYSGASGTVNAPASPNNIHFKGSTTTLNATASTFTANSGTVIFDGTAAQTLTPGSATFYNLTVNKTGGTFTVNTNDLNCDTGGTLTLTAAAGVTFNTPVSIPTLVNPVLPAKTFPITFNSNVDITGGSNTTIGTTGIVTLGNDTADILTFANGITVTSATSKSIAGTIQASSGNIDLSGNTTSITATATIGGTSTGAIKIGNATIATGTTLTLGAAAANVVTAGTISGTSASNLTINLSDTGSATIASIGANIDTFTITNSGDVTVSGTTTATTVNLTDTADTKTIDLQGSVSIGTLTTTGQGYNVRFGGGGSITGAATTIFYNTGDLRIAAGLSFTNGSLVATAPVKYIQGTVSVIGANTIDISGAATIITADATIGGLAATTGQIDIGAISIAALATLTLGQSGTGRIVTGAITSPGAGKGNLTFNTRAAGLSTIASLGSANIGTLTITNVGSGGLTFSGDVGALGTPLNSVVFVNTISSTGLVSFGGGIWTSAMTVNAGAAAYRITFSAGGSVTGATSTPFSNTGTLTIVNGFTFASGVTAIVQPKNIGGTIIVNTGNIAFGSTATTVSSDTTLDGSPAGSITLADTTLGNNVTLTLGNAVDSNTIAIGVITPGTGTEAVTVNNTTCTLSFNGNIGATGAGNSLETITLNMTGGSATFANGQAVYLDTLTTAGNGYGITFNSDTAVITNNTSFLNTGTLTLGNESTDSLSFANGITATAPSSISLAGNIHATASGASISLGSALHAIQLTTATRLDTVNGNITLGGTVNNAYTLTLNSGTADILASGSIGNLTSLGDITIELARNVTFSSTATATSFSQTNGTGTTLFSDAQNYSANFSFTGVALTINKSMSVTGTSTITNSGIFIKTPTGAITSNGGFTQSGAGTNTIGNNISTTNTTLSFATAITLTGDAAFSTQQSPGAGNVTLSSTIDGTYAFAITAGTGTVSAGRIGSLTSLASLSITGSTIDLYGIGSISQDGVSGTVSVTGTGAVSLYADYYKSTGAQTWTAATNGVRYRGTADGTWSAGGTGITCTTTSTDLYLDHNGCTLTLGSNLACRNLYFYRGIFTINGHTVETIADFVVFGNGYLATDPDWAIPSNTRFAYYGTGLLAYFPNGGTYNAGTGVYLTSPNASFSDLSGSTIQVDGNFYDNGADMTAISTCALNIPDNSASAPAFNLTSAVKADQWGTPYAVAFNMTVLNCPASTGFVAAQSADIISGTFGQKVISSGGNTNWQFGRPTLVSAKTMYDDVIQLTFSQNLENTNGEIEKAIESASPGSVWYDSDTLKFAKAYTSAECTTALSTTADTDIATFYIKTAGGTWNTDADGLHAYSASATVSTDSTNRAGVNQTTTPDLSFLKGLFYAADGKTMTPNYTLPIASASSTPGYRFTATSDHCAPVLVEVHTGQEAHLADNDASQQPYDAHNFIEFHWSEPVTIGSLSTSDVNIQSDATTNGGAITPSGGSSNIDIFGYAKIALGSLHTESRLSGSTTATDPATTVHALYRTFSINGAAAAAAQTNRLRVSIAGYATTGSGYTWFWPGVIASAVTPSGLVSDSASSAVAITDLAGNTLERFAAATYPRATVTVTPAPSGLYGPWDVSPPVLAALRAQGDSWTDAIDSYEAVPVASSGNISRIEMHFFDNTVAYSGADSYAWQSKKGWYTESDSSKTIFTQTSAIAPDAFGGSRPKDSPTSTYITTSGGIRESSLNMAQNAFTLFYNSSSQSNAASFSTAVSTPFMAPVISQNVSGDPYVTLNPVITSWPIAASSVTISYNTDGNPTPGYVTDLAGNLMQSFSKLKCLDRTAPQITITLAGAGRTDLYVLFSKKMDFSDVNKYLGITVSLSGGAAITPTGADVVGTTNRALLFHLPSTVNAADLVNSSSTITIADSLIPYTDPDTGTLGTRSYFQDTSSNYATINATHRLTDIAIGLVDILWASDGVNENGLLTTTTGALRVFDGTGRLLDRDITLSTRLNLTSAPGPLALYFDVNPPASVLPTTFNTAMGDSLKLWLPSLLSGFNTLGNQDARTLSPVTTSTDLLTRSFLIPEADAEVIPGSKIEMVMQYNGLYCARLTNSNDITSIAPWSFSISETKKQRGGVTILNNVIDANKREKTILQVEVPKAGNVVIQVFTLDGNVVKVLEHGLKGGGTYSYYWDGTNGAGNAVARGIYFIRVVGPNMDEIRKVLVVKE